MLPANPCFPYGGPAATRALFLTTRAGVALLAHPGWSVGGSAASATRGRPLLYSGLTALEFLGLPRLGRVA